MANFTKKAIRDSFVKLLNEKPLSQISVRDIVDDCGVNRNTFYYYYQDLPQLLETVVNEEIDRIIEEHPFISSPEEALNALLGFSLENRKAVMHIYQSINRDIFERFYWRVCEHVVTALMGQRMDERGIQGEERRMLLDYGKCVCFGITMGWMESGMQSNIQEFTNWLFDRRYGTLEDVLKRCEE